MCNIVHVCYLPSFSFFNSIATYKLHAIFKDCKSHLFTVLKDDLGYDTAVTAR